MKKRKNIIKKIALNKVFKLLYKKEFKHYFKESRLKDKFFYKVLFSAKSFLKINKLSKLYNYNILNINKNFLIKRYSYFSFITNGLDLKYNNLCEDLSNLDYLNSFNKRKTIILKNPDYDIIKYQKFITFIDNNCIYLGEDILNSEDFFKATYDVYYSFLMINYKFSYSLLLIY